MLEDVIACPNPDHGLLLRTAEGYTCTACGATFEVRNGIPVLLPTASSEA
jgi:uncharacterized protein YbaR (Trm112 family)